MSEHSNTHIAPPVDWQAFERHVRLLFEYLLQDPATSNNGRSGQAQHGVDVYGRRNADPDHQVGVQCKGKDPSDYGKAVTKAELLREVEKSDEFKPPLKEFVLVTTAPDDAKIQEEARLLTLKRKQEGRPLSVQVWGWGRLQQEINRFLEVRKAFDPDSTLVSEKLLANDARIEESVAKGHATTHGMLEEILQWQKSSLSIGRDTDSAASEGVNKIVHAQIDKARDILREGQSLTALTLLETYKNTVWDTADNKAKFRIITNIAAALSDLGKEQEAIPLFEEAVSYEPSHPLAQANLVLGLLFQRNYKDAVTKAQEILKDTPTNADAASYLIQACIPDKDITDPLTLVPEALHKSEAVVNGLIHFYRARGDSRWLELARESFKLFPASRHLERAVADAAMEEMFSAQGTLLGQKSEQSTTSEKTKEIATSLEALWQKRLTSQADHHDTSLPYNLIQMYRLQGDNTSAVRVASEALKQSPNAPDLTKLKAALLLEAKQKEEAITLLKSLPEDPEALLLLTVVIIDDEPAQALANGEKIFNDARLVRYKSQALELIVDAHIKLEQADQGLAFAKQYVEDNPNDIGGYLTLAAIESETGGDAIKILMDAKNRISDETPFNLRFLLANRFSELDEYAEVIELLTNRVDTSRDSIALMVLLSALINADRRKEAWDLLSTLPENLASQPNYLSAATKLHIRRSDYKAAKKSAEKYVEARPNELAGLLQLIEINYRQGDMEAVKAAVHHDPAALQGKPSGFMRYARLMDRFGLHQAALDLAYEKLLNHYDNADVQLGFISLLLAPSSSKAVNLHVDKVELNTAFVAHDKQGTSTVFIIEPDKKLRITEEMIAPEHPIAKAAVGLKVGESFKVGDQSNSPTLEIKQIKSKYLHALHEKMERFELAFPEHHGLRRFVFDEKAEKPLEEMLETIKRHHEKCQLVLNAYKDNPLPLEVFVGQLGSDVIDGWLGLSSVGHAFKAALGSEQERLEASNAITVNGKVGCVVDALTLYIIYRLNLLDAVTAVCGQVYTTESVKDVFRQRHEQATLHGTDSYMTIHYRDGKYYREEITKELIEERAKDTQAQLDWLQNIPVLAAESSHKFSEDAFLIKDAINLAFLDPILAAKESGKILLCEDLSYRQFAAKEAQLGTSWLQPAIMMARDKGALSQELYSEAIMQLLAAGHTYTCIDSSTLLCMSQEKDGWEPRFKLTLKGLFCVGAEPASHIRIMLGFISIIISKYGAETRAKAIIGMVLDRYFYGEWNGQGATVAKRVEILKASAVYQRIPIFRAYLDSWLIGHFIAPVTQTSRKSKKRKR